MRVRIFSDYLSAGSLPVYECPGPATWTFVEDDGETVKQRVSRRCSLPLFELASPTRDSILRSILIRVGCVWESKILDPGPAEDGTVIVAVKADSAIVNPQSVTGFTVVVHCGIGFCNARIERESDDRLFWIPRELDVTPDFWRQMEAEEAVEEVLTA